MGFAFVVDPWAVIVAAVVSFLVGWGWYSQALFGKIWMRESGISKNAMDKSKKKSMMTSMISGLIAQIVMAWVLAMFISATGGFGAVEGVLSAFWIWLGFVATISLGSVLWEGKSVTLFLVNSLHWLVALAIQGAIIGAWM